MRFSPPPRTVAVAMAIAIMATMPLMRKSDRRIRLIIISVRGRPYSVFPGTSLGELITNADLRATAGSLLDIHGDVLRPDLYPGRILLNRSQFPSGTTL